MPDTRSKYHRLVARIVALGLLLAVGTAQATAPTLRWRLVASHPHEASDFTQGLVWHQGRLFESAGQYGASRIAEKDLSSGKTLRSTSLPGNEFGEGLALLRGQLWQLTWREGVAHVYDLTLQPLQRLRYGGEGWGIASDGRQLVISDGSARLHFVDPEGFRLLRSIEVSDGGRPVTMLNELEWVEGAIYANVWMSDRVARIDPASGQVTGWLDLAPLKRAAGVTPEREAQGAVLNGLAWRADQRRLLVTGKWWPKLFELKLDVQNTAK
ncbi:MAG: glutaminyl-peptide cyclotransferase [Nevskiaceae bacterium]|jgi:glutamine cyclotransferase|nr:MAG: glutaminyl-peptide cyclotransferase [Nevskiaceae bacterium]